MTPSLSEVRGSELKRSKNGVNDPLPEQLHIVKFHRQEVTAVRSLYVGM